MPKNLNFLIFNPLLNRMDKPIAYAFMVYKENKLTIITGEAYFFMENQMHNLDTVIQHKSISKADIGNSDMHAFHA